LITRKARGNLVKYLVRVNILRLLLFMYYISLCTPSIAHFDLVSYLCMCDISRRIEIPGVIGASSSQSNY
jgi:hypothetical protein